MVRLNKQGMSSATTHNDVLARLTAEEKRALTRRSDLAGLTHLALHLGLLTASSLWIGFALPLWPLLLPVQGILLVFLFTLQHECTHKSPFQSPWLNEVVGHTIGALLLNPFIWFRYFHLAHHRFTNDPARDPELLAGAKPETWRAYIWYVSGPPYWIQMARQIVTSAMGRADAPYLPTRTLPRIAHEARLLLALYSLAGLSLLATPLLFWLWILPVLIGQPVLRLYLLAEHGRCKHVANMLWNTRTTFTNRAVRFLAWNMPYHIEHHSFPAVPFHQLPALHRHMRDELGVTAPGYTAFTREFQSKLD